MNRNILEEIDEIVNVYQPNHISAYILTVPKSYVHYSKLPDDDFVSDEYIILSNQLQDMEYFTMKFLISQNQNSQQSTIFSIGGLKVLLQLGASATGFLNLGETGVRYKWGTSLREVE